MRSTRHVEHGRQNRQHRQREADDGDEDVIDLFRVQRIEEPPHEVAAHKSPGVGPVVDARHDEAEHAHGQRPTQGLRTAPSSSRRAFRSTQAHRAAQRSTPTRPPSDRRRPAAAAEAQDTAPPPNWRQNPATPADHIDDDHAARTVQLAHAGRQLPDPHEVEDDVQQAAVQPRRAEHRPPAAVVEDRAGAGGAENKQLPQPLATRKLNKLPCRPAAPTQSEASRT